MSKVIVVGGAAAVALIIVFLLYRKLSKGNTKSDVTRVNTAKFEFEKLTRNFYRKMINAIAEMKKASNQQQLQVAQESFVDIQNNGNEDLAQVSEQIHKEFGIVMLPPGSEFDLSSAAIGDVDNVEFTWGSCAPDGVIRDCQTELRRARGDFE